MASLSIEQVDQQIRDYKIKRAEIDRHLKELESLRAGILKYGGNKPIQRYPRTGTTAPNTNGLRDAIRSLTFKAPFTVADVVKQLGNRGFDFKGRRPENAVRDSLYVMARKPGSGIRVVKKAQGNAPSEYEKTT